MERVTIKHKDVDRQTEIYPTQATIDRYAAAGWNVAPALKALKAMAKAEEKPTSKE